MPSSSRAPAPVPVPDISPVPDFSPVAARPGRRLRRVLRRGRRIAAATLAVTAAALTAAGHAAEPGSGTAEAERTEEVQPDGPPHTAEPPEPVLVSAPVRIADAAAVRLLSPGDDIDVLAAAPTAPGDQLSRATVVAERVRVAEVPEAGEVAPSEGARGALLVLAVPPPVAAALAGAAASAELAVTRW